jgi:hypothetical protein
MINALTRYLARPLDVFSTLTKVDRQALAAVRRCGDVLLCAGNTRCAELVKRLTRSTWSHVSMYVGILEDGLDPLCIVEADIAGGVRAIRLSDLDARRICVLRPVCLDDTERARLTQSVLRHIGREYDLAHAWLLARSLLVWRWWARLRSVHTAMGRSATHFICSSLSAQAFALIGHSIVPAGADAIELEANQNWLVPADFERASLFATVWACLAGRRFVGCLHMGRARRRTGPPRHRHRAFEWDERGCDQCRDCRQRTGQGISRAGAQVVARILVRHRPAGGRRSRPRSVGHLGTRVARFARDVADIERFNVILQREPAQHQSVARSDCYARRFRRHTKEGGAGA